MKKLILATLACLMAVFMYAQKSDGIVYWSYGAGYQFDFDLDGKIDLTVPTQTKDLQDRKSTRLNSSHASKSRMPSSA